MKTIAMMAGGVCLWLAATGLARAQSSAEADKQAYCRYVEDQATAQRSLDTGLQAYGRLGQADTTTDKEAVVGVQVSLSRQLQGRSVTRSAQLECALYRVSLDVDRATKFAMLRIDQRVAAERVQSLKGVLGLIDEEIASAQKRERAGEATIDEVLGLTDQRETLFAQFTAAQTDAAQIIPAWDAVNLSQALVRIDDTTRHLQDELSHQQALQAWDVALVGGVMKPFAGAPADTSMRTQPFVSVNVTYNFNAPAYRRNLDEATDALMAMQHAQNDQLYQRVTMLRRSLAQSLNIEQEGLPALQAEADRLDQAYARLQHLDSAEAVRMRAKLRISRAMAQSELALAQLKLNLLGQAYAQTH